MAKPPVRQSSFLGKAIPRPVHQPAAEHRTARREGAIRQLFLGSLGAWLIAGGLAYAANASSNSASLATVSASPSPRNLNNLIVGTVQAASPSAPSSPSSPDSVSSPSSPSSPGTAAAPVIPNPCITGKVGEYSTTKIFPLLPSGITSEKAGECTPQYWNLYILKVFAWKTLGLINYAAFSLAILLTVYAGLLYISGFASEANVKRAKTILTACYIGLAIVYGSRIILFGTISELTGANVDPTAIDGNSTP